jgi:hypothetical protein
MSYGIVRVQKMGKGSVKGIEIHDRREKDGISHTNKDIDWERTKLNYDLHPSQNNNFYKAIKTRIENLNLKKAVRKDAVVMAQVLVTSDHDFFKRLTPSRQEQFFKDSYDFLKDRYGEKNIISATVHLDERTPHMHFNFVPVTEDGRLSAKSLLTRQSLIEQQTAFYEHVGKHYGLERGIPGGTKTHLEVAEYKVKTAIEKEHHALKNAQNALEMISKAERDLMSMEMKLASLRAEYEAKRAYVETCNKESDISMLIPEYAKLKKTLLGNETITVPLEKWEKRHISANEKNYLEKATKEFEKSISDFKETASAGYIKKLENAVKSMNNELNKIKGDNKILLGKLNESENDLKKVSDKINNVLEKFPDEIAERFVQILKHEQQKDYDLER